MLNSWSEIPARCMSRVGMDGMSSTAKPTGAALDFQDALVHVGCRMNDNGIGRFRRGNHDRLNAQILQRLQHLFVRRRHPRHDGYPLADTGGCNGTAEHRAAGRDDGCTLVRRDLVEAEVADECDVVCVHARLSGQCNEAHPLMAPAVTPSVMRRWKTRNMTRGTAMAMTRAALSAGTPMPYSPLIMAMPSVRVREPWF